MVIKKTRRECMCSMLKSESVILRQDNMFDFARVAKQLEFNAEFLMGKMTKHFNKLMETRVGWIKNEDRLPPNDCSVLMAIYDGRPGVEMFFIGLGYRMNSSWYYGHDGSEIRGKGRRVTHWMALPDAPDRDGV